MKQQITHISLVQTAKVAAILYFVFAAIGIVLLLLAAGLGVVQRPESLPVTFLTPFLYAFFGFVFVFIAAWLYNVVAKRFGGIEFTLTDTTTRDF